MSRILRSVACLLAASALAASTTAQVCWHPSGDVDFELYGDIGGNGTVSVADVVCFVAAALTESAGDPLSGLSCIDGDPKRADLNCDDTVDIIDVQASISLALGVGTPTGFSPDGNGCPSSCSNTPPPVADGTSCQSVLADDPLSTTGTYTVDPDGAGGAAPYDIYCDFDTPGQGWSLAMRFGSTSQFTFYSPLWTNAQLLNETVSPADPNFDGDAKFQPFVNEVAEAIRGCLHNPATGALTCFEYDLPADTTLRDLFGTTPIGSDTSGLGGEFFSSDPAEVSAWIAAVGATTANLTNAANGYQRVGINIDDDTSCFDARVRFGAVLNNQADVFTLNDAVGFGATGYFSEACDHESTDPPGWSVGAGLSSDKATMGEFARRGTIWVRSAPPAPTPRSCLEIKLDDPMASSGTYTIDPDGDGPNAATDVYCDMSVGFTFQLQGTVNNEASAILGGCSGGLEPFEVRSELHSQALESFVTGLGSDATAWYLANVFTGAAPACPTPAPDFGWLTDPSTWNDANVDETGLLNLSSNCNLGGFDPVPLNQVEGYANRGNPVALLNISEATEPGTLVCGLNDITLTGTSCQAIADIVPTLDSGVYTVDPDGAGALPAQDVYCDFDTPGEGWTLAMRFGSTSGFTFYNSAWTNSALVNETVSPDDPNFDGDAKFAPFVNESAAAVRGCLVHPSSGATGCRDYDLPSASTLLDLFTNSPIGSDSTASGALVLSSDTSEASAWLANAGVTAGNLTTASNSYQRIGINLDDDLSCFDARVRFGLVLNNQADVNTLNDALGFGASGYYTSGCDHESTDPPWSVGAGLVSDKGPNGEFARRGSIWVRGDTDPNPAASCRELREANSSLPSGTYTIDVDGVSGPQLPVSVHCDMATGHTLLLQGQVQNSPSSIFGGCGFGFEPFAIKSESDAAALENYILSLGNDSNAWYYANVFAGPTIGCPTPANEYGWLSNPTTWNDAFVDESNFFALGNCNLGDWDPIPLNQVDGYDSRNGASPALLNPSEAVQTGTVVCSLNDAPVALASCAQHKLFDPSAASGQYTIDPDGAGGLDPFTTYCEMDMMGGGWTLAGVQVSTDPYSLRTTNDISPANFGRLDASWRYSNARIQSIVPDETWLIQSKLVATGNIIDNGYFSPSCVIDWDRNVGNNEDPVVPECSTAYTDATFSSILGGTANPSNSSLGIGQNNSGGFCSIRMANNNAAATGFQAAPCDFFGHPNYDMFLWAR